MANDERVKPLNQYNGYVSAMHPCRLERPPMPHGQYRAAMETWDAIRARRNVRQFADRPISADDLDRILEAGRRAPSSRNWQPWDLVVVTDRDQLGRLSQVWRGGAHIAGAAAAIALVGPVIDDDERARGWLFFDHGQLAMQLQLQAADLGIGSSHSAIGDQGLAREILGHPEDRFCVALFSLGYPVDRPLQPLARPDRRAFGEVVHRGRW
jgi:nitroreductase